jgi:hypothetical protein
LREREREGKGGSDRREKKDIDEDEIRNSSVKRDI